MRARRVTTGSKRLPCSYWPKACSTTEGTPTFATSAAERSRWLGRQGTPKSSPSCWRGSASRPRVEHLLEEAAEHLTEALEHALTLNFLETAGWCCEGLALVAAERSDFVRAARLLGAGESLRREGGSTIQPAEAAVREVTMATLRPALPADLLQLALEAGRALTLDAAAAEALAGTHVL